MYNKILRQIGAKCKEITIQIFNECNIQIFMIKKQYTIKTRLEMREEMSCFKIRILYNFATRKEKYLPQAKFFSSILFIDSYRSRYFKPKLIIGLIRSFRLCKTMCTYFSRQKYKLIQRWFSNIISIIYLKKFLLRMSRIACWVPLGYRYHFYRRFNRF